MSFRIAMLGVGVIAQFYLRALAENQRFSLVCACDRDPSKLERLRRMGIATTCDVSDAATRPDVDAVIINLPNDLHFRAARAALKSGKHVCCEKPLTLDCVQAADLRELARTQHRVLFTAFHRRYNCNFAAARRDLTQRGQIRSVVARYFENIEQHAGDDRWYLDPARSGGGCLADNGPNVLDALRVLLDDNLQVEAAQLTRDPSGVDVDATLQLLAGGGVPVDAKLDWRYAHGEVKDILVLFRDEPPLRIDFLQDFSGFKGSLWHEYQGVLDHFALACSGETHRYPSGVQVVRMVSEAYSVAEARSQTA